MRRPVAFPLQFLLAFFAAFVNRHQQRILDYVMAENRALREVIGKKRIRLNDDQRRRLAVLGKALGRKLLKRFAMIVTPETILAWHQRLVAQKWTYLAKRVGRPMLGKDVVELVVKIARENPTWGYCRIQGALANVGRTLSSSAVASILKAHGLQPAPSRRTSWSVFLKAHLEGLAAADFLNVEVWTLRGLRTYLVLFAIRIATRRVELLGITDHVDADFARQAARNLIDDGKESMRGVTHLIIDRDGKFTPAFKGVVKHGGVKAVLTPPRSPNCNAFAERFVQTLKHSVLDRMIFFGEASLRRAVTEFVEQHYAKERNHQGIGNAIPAPGPEVGRKRGAVRRKDRLGGMLRYYYREAV